MEVDSPDSMAHVTLMPDIPDICILGICSFNI